MDLVTLIVWVAVLIIVLLVLWWLLQQLPLDPMAQKIITIAVVVIVAVVAIAFLLKFSGAGSVRVGDLGLVTGLLV